MSETLAALIRRHLAKGPLSSAALGSLCCVTSRQIGVSVSTMVQAGIIQRADGRSGTGFVATWELVPDRPQKERFWTEDKIAEAKRLYAEGMSTASIACIVGAASRNAVIGVLHRQGATNTQRANAGAQAARIQTRIDVGSFVPRMKSGPRLKPPPKPTQTLQTILVPVENDPKRLIDLAPRECKWPMNDPEPFGDYLFCAAHTDEGPYCRSHSRVAYTPPQANLAPPSADRRRFNGRQFPGGYPAKKYAE